jgi:hypothetical protein
VITLRGFHCLKKDFKKINYKRPLPDRVSERKNSLEDFDSTSEEGPGQRRGLFRGRCRRRRSIYAWPVKKIFKVEKVGFLLSRCLKKD